jgi:DNA polymerase-1
MPSDGEKGRLLYLIDGSSYIYRAYHAIRHLSNSKGFPTNAIFGFSKMLLKLISEESPRYLGLVFDVKGPTFRHALYEDYKATRPPMPEELAFQIPYIHTIAKHLRLAVIEKEGFEADDVIGTLARLAEEDGFNVIVVTGDKDFRQIISPHTTLWDTMKDKHMNGEILKEELGVSPEKMVEIAGLSGDSSDNIPGVPGIGEKTAAELIREFGDIEGVFKNLHAIKKKKLKENLERSYEKAVLSKKLATIDRSVPLEHAIEDLAVGEPDAEALAALFRELEFRDLMEQFSRPKESMEKDYRLVLSEEEFLDLVRNVKKSGLVALDMQIAGDRPMRSVLVGASLCSEKSKAYYIPLTHTIETAPVFKRAFDDLLGDETVLKIGHNLKPAILVARSQGIELRGIHFDAMVASYVLNPGLRQHDLGHLSQRFFDHKLTSYQEVVGKGKSQVSFLEIDPLQAKDYSCEIAEMSFRLKDMLEEQLRSDMNEGLFYDMEMKLIAVLADMEWQGIKVDTDFLRDLSGRYSVQLKQIEREIYEEAGFEFNINSPQQLGYVLFEKLQLPVQKKTTKTKSYSTDVSVLTKLTAFPSKIPKHLLRYRTLSKLQSTYIDALIELVDPKTGRIHTSFNQTVTATGRLSSSDPNLQNIPVRGEEGREIRKSFVAEKGCYLLSADYSQIELRIFAHYSEDPAFLEAFSKGEDIHARTASEVLGVPVDQVTPDMRRIAKAINFGIIYGMGPQSLSEGLGIDLKSAKEYISAYYRKYQGVTRYREASIQSARETGYVTTLFNRRRYLPDILHENRVIRAEAERMAVNTPIQGTAADLIKKAMIRIHDKLKKEKSKSRMLLQVHDELLFEVPEEEVNSIGAMVKEEMEGVYPLRVPLGVDTKIGRNWDEAH